MLVIPPPCPDVRDGSQVLGEVGESEVLGGVSVVVEGVSAGTEALVPDGACLDVDVDGEVLVLVGAAEAADLFVLGAEEAEGVDGASNACDGRVGDVLLLSDECGDPSGDWVEGGVVNRGVAALALFGHDGADAVGAQQGGLWRGREREEGLVEESSLRALGSVGTSGLEDAFAAEFAVSEESEAAVLGVHALINGVWEVRDDVVVDEGLNV